jgi:uracil-DNA glycosylase
MRKKDSAGADVKAGIMTGALGAPGFFGSLVTPGPKTMLMVGEAPSPTSDPEVPIISGRSGRWLRWLLGEHWSLFYEACAFINLVETYPGPLYPLETSRHAAREVLESVVRPRTLILCGRKVSSAFGYAKAEFLSVADMPRERLVFLPHPSGLCRWWNDEHNRSRARAQLLFEVFESSRHAERVAS